MKNTRPRTFSTGFEKSRVRNYVNIVKHFYRKNSHFAWHDYHVVFGHARKVLEQYIAKEIQDCQILEIGCGQRFATTLLFHSLGARITGIDTDLVEPTFSFKGIISIWKTNGIERALKTFVRHVLFDRTYYKILEKEFGRPLRMHDVDILTMNACFLDFPNDHFDYVFSNAVFEHIDNVDAACSEVARVLKIGGIAHILIHLFPSLSGGHNPGWAYPDEVPSKSVPPWDHLRQNLFPSNAYLNKLRERDYLSVFERYFNVLNVESQYEGEQFLSDGILKELVGFTREELLKRNIRVVVKK